MPNIKFLFFFLIINFILFVIDYYVLHYWRRYIIYLDKNKYFWKIPQLLSVLFILISLLNSIDKMFYHNLSNSTSNFLFAVTTVWFFPKVLIALVLLVKSIVKFITNLIVQTKRKSLTVFTQSEKNEKNESRRKFIKEVSWNLAIIPFLSAGYGIVYGRKNLHLVNQTYFLPNLPNNFNNFKIIQISDLHLGSFSDTTILWETVIKVNSLNPNLILVTGDFVNSDPKEMLPFIEALAELKATNGVYGCLGNHDHYMTDKEHQYLLSLIKKAKIKLITNNCEKIYIGKEYISLAGVDNWGMDQEYGDFNKAQNVTDFSTTSILMCHDPNNWRKFILNKIPYDLTLSGHTHGGQIGFESEKLKVMPAALVYEFYAGNYQINNQSLYVNRGLGTTGPPLRLGVPPEITVFALYKATNLA